MSFAISTIGGFLGRDPEAKITSTGNRMCVFPLCWTVKMPNAEKTCSAKVACFQTQADFCLKYLKKGAFITVTGDMEISDYVLGNGEKKTQLCIKASHVYAADKIQLNSGLNNKSTQRVSQAQGYQYPKSQQSRIVFSNNGSDKETSIRKSEELDSFDDSQHAG